MSPVWLIGVFPRFHLPFNTTIIPGSQLPSNPTKVSQPAGLSVFLRFQLPLPTTNKSLVGLPPSNTITYIFVQLYSIIVAIYMVLQLYIIIDTFKM